MPLFEVTDSGLQAQTKAEFAALGMYERADLQRLLRDEIGALGEDLLVVSEEFGEWEDARRRIDLLGLDRDGHLVVIELKRTDDGGHMELQAIRYAAMVSSMGFDEVLRALSAHRAKHPSADAMDPRIELVTFLGTTEDEDEPVISSDVRIVLVSADFGREITTAVLWLNRFEGMDIRCVRLVPYDFDGRVLLDIQQVIPLPEAADYQVKIRRKDSARDRKQHDGRDLTRYHVIVDGDELPDENKRNAIRVMIDQLVSRGTPISKVREVLPDRALKVLPGQLAGGDAVRAALAELDPKVQVRRYFTEHAWIDELSASTYVLFKMWGLNTEPTLKAASRGVPGGEGRFPTGRELRLALR